MALSSTDAVPTLSMGSGAAAGRKNKRKMHAAPSAAQGPSPRASIEERISMMKAIMERAETESTRSSISAGTPKDRAPRNVRFMCD